MPPVCTFFLSPLPFIVHQAKKNPQNVKETLGGVGVFVNQTLLDQWPL